MDDADWIPAFAGTTEGDARYTTSASIFAIQYLLSLTGELQPVDEQLNLSVSA